MESERRAGHGIQDSKTVFLRFEDIAKEKKVMYINRSKSSQKWNSKGNGLSQLDSHGIKDSKTGNGRALLRAGDIGDKANRLKLLENEIKNFNNPHCVNMHLYSTRIYTTKCRIFHK